MDRDTVVRAQAGDVEAFGDLARASLGRLTAVARMVLRDEHRAQDAVQEALIDAWRDLDRLRDPDRFDAWIYRLLMNACSNHARRAWRRQVMEIRLTPEASPSTSGSEGQVDLHDQLERGLERLTAEQRAVLVLAYYVDLPLAAAAEALAIPLGTMKSRLHRATEALRAVLEADAREPVVVQERFA